MAVKITPRQAAALKAAGITLGAAPESPLLPPGTLIVDFEVPFRPVPWSPPRISPGRHSFKDRRLVAWQEAVARCARIAMGGRAPYPGPVRVSMRFYLSPRGGSPPDASNLGKATEDALQGTVIVNDRRVVDVRSRRFPCRVDRAVVEVFAVDEPLQTEHPGQPGGAS